MLLTIAIALAALGGYAIGFRMSRRYWRDHLAQKVAERLAQK